MFWHRLIFWRQKRDIFTFWDGKRKRSIDPMPAFFAMGSDDECHPPRDLPLADTGDREAWLKVQGMARRMFGIKTLEDGGLTEDEINTVLAQFLVFITVLKKKLARSRMQWALTAGAQPEESITQPDAESCSTSTESKSDEP